MAWSTEGFMRHRVFHSEPPSSPLKDSLFTPHALHYMAPVGGSTAKFALSCVCANLAIFGVGQGSMSLVLKVHTFNVCRLYC